MYTLLTLRPRRRQKRFKIPRSDKEGGRGGRKEGRSRNNNHSSDSSLEHDIKKPPGGGGLKSAADMFGLPPLSGPGALAANVGGGGEDVGLPPTKVEKHDYKYSLHDKYGVEGGPELGGADHLVLPAAPLGKHDGGYDALDDKYQAPDMSHLSPVPDLHSRYAEGLLSLRPPDYASAANPFSIHRLLPGGGSPMHHPALSKAELHYADYGLQNHASLHHEAMYYNPPVYQVGGLMIA